MLVAWSADAFAQLVPDGVTTSSIINNTKIDAKTLPIGLKRPFVDHFRILLLALGLPRICPTPNANLRPKPEIWNYNLHPTTKISSFMTLRTNGWSLVEAAEDAAEAAQAAQAAAPPPHPTRSG